MNATPDALKPAPHVKKEESIILIPHPKIVFLWPSWVLSIVASIYMYFWGDASLAGAAGGAGTWAEAMAWTFLIVLGLNCVVLAFDFPRSTSLLLFAIIVAAVLGGSLLIINFPNLLPAVNRALTAIDPVANSTFYFLFSVILSAMFITVAVVARLDYWEVRPNELLHHHGFLSDLERFSAPNLKIDKEINDVFEFMLLGAGRLVLHPSNQPRAIVLDNVFFITQKEQAITKMLSALQVQVRDESV